jgi:hypothetical protein
VNEFTDVFVHATAAIGPEYFLLPIHGGESRYRERVYCYELYHQARLRWPPGTRYFLNGEIDKRSHPYFAGEADAPKPDFVVHVPGTGDNYAVMEVKTRMAVAADIRVDIGKLTRFRTEFGYRRAVYLIYGETPDEAAARVQKADVTDAQIELVEIWGHPEVGRPASRALPKPV